MNHRDQRRAARLDHELLVAYRTPRGFVSQWAVNLSRGGLFVNTPHPMPVGSALELLVHLPDRHLPVQLRGKVAWLVQRGARRGMGIEFTGAEDAKRARIETVVRTLRRGLGANDGGREDVAPE